MRSTSGIAILVLLFGRAGDLVAKRVVKTDEKLIRLSSNVDPATGVYNQQPFAFEKWRRTHAHDVAAMADIVLSETAPRSRPKSGDQASPALHTIKEPKKRA